MKFVILKSAGSEAAAAVENLVRFIHHGCQNRIFTHLLSESRRVQLDNLTDYDIFGHHVQIMNKCSGRLHSIK